MEVRIYRPSKSAMQSGRSKGQCWQMEYVLTSARRPEDLMGWTSSNDTLNQVKLKFETLDHAIEFANKKGWAFSVQDTQERRISPKNYVDNFKYVPADEVSA